MKRNVKWTVLAMALASAMASVANAETTETILVYDEDTTIDDTRNYTTNVDTTTNTTTNTSTDTYTNTETYNTDYSDTFDWNTSIDENYVDNQTNNYTNNETYTTDYSDTFDWNTSINEEFNTTVNQEANLLVNQSLTTIEEYENVQSDVRKERNEHAVSVTIEKDLSLSSDIEFTGSPTLTGEIDIDSAAIAVIDNRQQIGDNVGLNYQLTNDASIDEDTASTASGNLQFNAAAGDNNVQDNAAALSAADASFSFGLADAEVFVNQLGAGNQTLNLGVTNDASIGGNAFSSASGNIGVNVTSGNNNAQKNALAASVATSAYAQASVSSNQVSSGNGVINSPLEREETRAIDISLSGAITGTTASTASGTYGGNVSGTYSGTGAAYQMDNFYLDSWDGELDHPNGDPTGHLDMDNDIQNAVENPNKPGVGGIAFDTKESGTWDLTEAGNASFQELGTADLQASLSGTVVVTSLEVVAAATNSAVLSGSAFSGASGNIGVNVSAGTGNQQANSLSMAVAQPSTGGGDGGGGGG